MAEPLKNRVHVYSDNGRQKLGEIDAEATLRVRLDPLAETTERYVIDSVENGIAKFNSTNSGSTRYPHGVNCLWLFTKIEDLTNSSLVLADDGYPLPGNRTPTTAHA